MAEELPPPAATRLLVQGAPVVGGSAADRCAVIARLCCASRSATQNRRHATSLAGQKSAQKIQNERREDLANLKAIRRLVGRLAIRGTRGFSWNQIAFVCL